MNKSIRQEIFERFRAANPHPTTELNFNSPFELLIAVLLSAQATDVGVNKATAKLFPIADTPQAMLDLGLDGVMEYTKTIGLYKTKSKHIMQTCRILLEKYKGEVPEDREALESLPGVGRKTANVVHAVAFHKAALAVDTHVFRVSHRLGLVPKTANTPYKVEMALKKYIPEEKVAPSHFWLLLHGRYVCTALRPKCDKCDLRGLCKGPLQIKKR